MFRLIIVVFLFVSVCFSQQNNAAKQLNQTEGEEIISKARQVSGLDQSGQIPSYRYKLKKTLLTQNSSLESFEEASLNLPGKIQVTYGMDSPFFSRLTRTWSGEKYKSISESESAGQRTVKDVTVEETKPISVAVSDVIGKKAATAFQEAKKIDPKTIYADSLWTSLFPLVLSHPFEKNIEFKYAGKAKSNDKTANVIDVKSTGGKTYRMLFDSETSYLLMMIVSSRESNPRFTGNVETKYYFSERELTGGVLIPKKIKIEEKITPDGKPTVLKYSNIEVVDFKLNPKFDEKTFAIK